MLHEQAQEFSRYGITLEQMLQYRGLTHDEAVAQLLPQGEQRLKNSLVLREVIKAEGITIEEDEIEAEVERMLGEYPEEQRDNVRAMLSSQLRTTVATGVLNQKLRDRLFKLATGAATDQSVAATESSPVDSTDDDTTEG